MIRPLQRPISTIPTNGMGSGTAVLASDSVELLVDTLCDFAVCAVKSAAHCIQKYNLGFKAVV